MSESNVHKVYLDPPGVEIEAAEDENILEAAFKAGVMLFHGCKEGQCSACKNFLLAGDVQHLDYSTFALAEYEEQEGFVLLCRAYAYSDCEIEVLHWDDDMLTTGVPIREYQTEIAQIEHLTHDLRRLTLNLVDPPEAVFNPGQYMDVKIPGTDYTRAYSMANTPSTDNQLQFIIKVLPDGKFSSLLEGELSPGDPLDIKGPYGTFTLRKKSDSDIIFIGGGAGLAPILSLMKSMAEEGIERKATFFYGARTAADICLTDEIDEIGRSLKDFTYIPALSEPTPEDTETWTGEVGLITEVVERLAGDVSQKAVYLCGPPPMIDAAIDVLLGMGANEEAIYFDKFTVSASFEETK